MTLLAKVYFFELLLNWTTKWTSLSPEFLPLRDLPPTRLRALPPGAFVIQFFLRKGIRIVYDDLQEDVPSG